MKRNRKIETLPFELAVGVLIAISFALEFFNNPYSNYIFALAIFLSLVTSYLDWLNGNRIMAAIGIVVAVVIALGVYISQRKSTPPLVSNSVSGVYCFDTNKNSQDHFWSYRGHGNGRAF